MIYEERFTTVGLRTGREYLDVCRRNLISALRSAGARVLCLATGLIGDPGNCFLQMTEFADVDAWRSAQSAYSGERERLVESEQVRLLRAVASRPKATIPPEDRRPTCSYRRFFISASDLGRFVQCSEEGVWPLHEAAGGRVLGLWTPLASTSPMEIVLMSGYHGPAHWEETRFLGGKPAGIDDSVWERGRTLGAERNRLLVRGSWVRLFRAHEID